MEDKRSLDIATGRRGGSEGRDDERSGTRGGALEGYTLATRRRFKSLSKDAECAHHSGGKRNIYGITEIRRMRAIGRPDRGARIPENNGYITFTLSPMGQEGDIGRF